MKSSCAVMFPGQGSQREGMRALVDELRPDLAGHASEVVGGDPFSRVNESTRFLQPAVYCVSLAGWERYRRDRGEPPDFFAGHSLGEFAALVAAGSLDELDGLRLVALRGELMERAARGFDGGMLALMGPGVRAFAERAGEFGVGLAGDNSPEQLVLSGPRGGLEAARRAAREEGVKGIMLKIAGAFHHHSLEEVVPEFEAALAEVEFRSPDAPVFSGVTAAPFDEIRSRLAEGLLRPVLWRQILLELHRRGVRRFVEAGPGHVLVGLVEWNLPDDVEALTMDAEEASVA